MLWIASLPAVALTIAILVAGSAGVKPVLPEAMDTVLETPPATSRMGTRPAVPLPGTFPVVLATPTSSADSRSSSYLLPRSVPVAPVPMIPSTPEPGSASALTMAGDTAARAAAALGIYVPAPWRPAFAGDTAPAGSTTAFWLVPPGLDGHPMAIITAAAPAEVAMRAAPEDVTDAGEATNAGEATEAVVPEVPAFHTEDVPPTGAGWLTAPEPEPPAPALSLPADALPPITHLPPVATPATVSSPAAGETTSPAEVEVTPTATTEVPEVSTTATPVPGTITPAVPAVPTPSPQASSSPQPAATPSPAPAASPTAGGRPPATPGGQGPLGPALAPVVTVAAVLDTVVDRTVDQAVAVGALAQPTSTQPPRPPAPTPTSPPQPLSTSQPGSTTLPQATRAPAPTTAPPPAASPQGLLAPVGAPVATVVDGAVNGLLGPPPAKYPSR